MGRTRSSPLMVICDRVFGSFVLFAEEVVIVTGFLTVFFDGNVDDVVTLV